MSKYPQVLIDAEGATADEKLAPLINMVGKLGFTPRFHNQGNPDPDAFDQAFFSFSNAEEALAFLIQTAQYFDFVVGNQMILTVVRPLGDDNNAPAGGMVFWHPGFTETLTETWRREMPPL